VPVFNSFCGLASSLLGAALPSCLQVWPSFVPTRRPPFCSDPRRFRLVGGYAAIDFPPPISRDSGLPCFFFGKVSETWLFSSPVNAIGPWASWNYAKAFCRRRLDASFVGIFKHAAFLRVMALLLWDWGFPPPRDAFSPWRLISLCRGAPGRTARTYPPSFLL